MLQTPADLALLETRLPRYTSYPPANRFTPQVSAESRAGWLAALAADEAVSLYAHIPFCRRLCWFCACRTQGSQSRTTLDLYLDDLEREARLTRAAIGRRQKIAELHLGGGTPTLLAPDQLDRLGAMLDETFDLSGASEISVEIDPVEFDAARAEALARLGMTRASIGVQDFDPRVQDAIGRDQGLAATTDAVRLLRAAGIHSLNVDLLYGLPFQDHGSLRRTLAAVIGFAPDRIALYGYAHVPWVAKRQKLIPEDALPDAPARLELAAAAREQLLAAGYEAIGIDHFALPGDSMAAAARSGRLRRNFQGYTTDQSPTLIGLGASAVSRYREGYSQNISATRDWKTAIASGTLPAARGWQLSATDRIAAGIIERLMCDGAADIAAIASGQGQAPAGWLSRARDVLAKYPGAGRLDGARLTAERMAYARLLASGFDDPEGLSGMRYSMAS